MALVPYTATALAESDADGTNGKNIVAGAVVSASALVGGAVATLYDNASGSNPSTSKVTGSNGQVTFYIEEGEYTLTVNGVEREMVTVGLTSGSENYHANGNGVTAADAAIAIKGAKDGGIGVLSSAITDLHSPVYNRVFYAAGSTAANSPSAAALAGTYMSTNVPSYGSLLVLDSSGKLFTKTKAADVWSDWQELYHTGNTGGVKFGEAIPGGGTSNFLGLNATNITPTHIATSVTSTANTYHWLIYNGNGNVGGVTTNNTSTSYNTSSDNRLKIEVGKPTDEEVNQKFNDIYDTFTCFNWKTDENGQKVWGFFAHDVLDRGLDFASEGEGPRELNIGDVYDTTPAVTEQRAILDEGGNETGEFETVEVTPAIEHKVTPAGVDQSKVVPYLVAKIEQLERRLKAAGL